MIEESAIIQKLNAVSTNYSGEKYATSKTGLANIFQFFSYIQLYLLTHFFPMLSFWSSF